MDIGDEMGPDLPAFPDLRPGNNKITSIRTRDYNCIAWAAGDDTRWWWPVDSNDAYWPPNITRRQELDAFVEAFATLGYEPTLDGEWEAGREKVAIFAEKGLPTHAARQLSDGTWSSKLGQSFDISHSLEAIEGPAYGQAVLFMSRDVEQSE